MGEGKSSIGGISPRRRAHRTRLHLGLALLGGALLPLAGHAQTIADAITSSGGISYTIDDPAVGFVNTTVADGATLPVAFTLGTFAGQNAPYTLNNAISGTFDFTMPAGDTTTGALFDYTSSSGIIALTSTATISLDGLRAGPEGGIGTAAIRVLGLPQTYSGVTETGGNANITLFSGNLTVTGTGNRTTSGPALNPAGFRTADLSGVLALSYGKQAPGASVSHPGGSASVVLESATITMTQTDSSIVTAGISAASASGTGLSAFGVGTPPQVNVQLIGGRIVTNADSGLGILATSTGASLPTSGAPKAYGANVLVWLDPDSDTGTPSTITANGTTGIGIFASSTVYLPGEPQRSTPSQAGNATVQLFGNGTTITTGSANSTFAAGVLAISAGGEGFLNPFSSQPVNATGASGDSGAVTINSTATVQTQGTLSIGLAGLSVGGGGTVTTATATSGISYLGLNGTETIGGGSSVTITNSGAITTLGKSAYGIVAISTAAGGILNNEFATSGNTTSPSGLAIGSNSGTGSGSAGVNGGAVTVTQSGRVTTGDGFGTGVAAIGITAQSIGGGGGNAGGQHAALFVGDAGGKGGNGGVVDVAVSSAGAVTTRDVNSLGILAQSIGGGGGNGGNAEGLFVAVGGKGGSGGAGGAITADIAGNLTTQADHSAALIAQSVGGGGGHGGTSTSIGLVFDVGIGGKGGSGGRGGNVTTTLEGTAAVTTRGNNSAGVLLQSIGGGGGTGGAAIGESASIGIDVQYSMGGSGGSGGNAGAVTGTNNGTITTGTAPAPGGTVGAPRLDGADSIGMLAQSIGGGGGHGGGAIGKDLVLQLPILDPASGNITGFAISLTGAVGGSGGVAGDGGSTGLANAGAIQTWGDGSHGLLAQSIGGGGGSGGDSTAYSLLLALSGFEGSANVAVGGSGGAGGNGGGVTAANSASGATITTHGQNASGITAQSIGGGGGISGFGNAGAGDPTLWRNGPTSFTSSVGVGGTGGAAGNAGPTVVTNNGTITTTGSGSPGIVAQAIGGGGGLSSGGAASGSNNNLTLNLSIGNKGGNGGSATATSPAGYSVQVTNNGTIATAGGDATAIFAQSIGGGGGAGGSSDATAPIGIAGTIVDTIFSTGYAPKLTIGISAAGGGGSGGAGGKVLVTQSGQFSTDGSRAYGILAQSLSGGGGLGGSATAASNPGLLDGYNGSVQFATDIAVGGDGGDSHGSGEVIVNNTSANATTSGYGSHGIVAQSIAGGGGIGGDGTADVTSTLGLGIGVNRPTSGTSSAAGGTVLITQSGALGTSGGDAVAIVAQSVGGGGGIASTGRDIHTVTANYTIGLLPLHAGVTLGINLNGSGSSDGGAVQVALRPGSTLTTSGDWSHGIVAQSVGAGGGKASTIFGTNSNASADLAAQLGATLGAGNADTVTINLTSTGSASASTAGYGAIGVLGQAIGGGGGLFTDGSSLATGNVTLGAAARGKGTGGTVTLLGGQSATVSTSGPNAFGIVLQSIGGGGGLAGTGSNLTYAGNATGQPAPTIRLGGTDADGRGGTVTTNATLAISTTGANAFGLVAQSIGGGGGLATSKQVGTGVLGATSASLSSDHYNGGTVNLNLLIPESTALTTTGSGAHGLVAQSIGGGGGILNPSASSGGINATPNAANGSATALGYGGDVSITLNGSIQTSGAGAAGIVAQSVSGGGGLQGSYAGSTGGSNASGFVHDSGNNAGNVIIRQELGVIHASGVGATGIFAQNVTAGNHGLGSVQITVNDTVIGGNGTSAYGVWVDGGNLDNLLTVGAVASISAGSGNAVNYTGTVGRLNVTNDGTIAGNIQLNGLSTITNNGTLANPTALVGNVTNKSQLNLNDTATTGLTITGNFTQFSTAQTTLDIWSATNFNTINITGAVDYKGTLTVNFTQNFLPAPGATFALFTAGSGSYTFSSVFVTGLGPGAEWQRLGTGDSFVLEITSVPEPAAFAGAVVLFLAGIALLRRRPAIKPA